MSRKSKRKANRRATREDGKKAKREEQDPVKKYKILIITGRREGKRQILA
jgi:hypothetical protein